MGPAMFVFVLVLMVIMPAALVAVLVLVMMMFVPVLRMLVVLVLSMGMSVFVLMFMRVGVSMSVIVIVFMTVVVVVIVVMMMAVPMVMLILIRCMGRAFVNRKLHAFDFLPFRAVEVHVKVADIQLRKLPLERRGLHAEVDQGADGHVAADAGNAVEIEGFAHGWVLIAEE